MDGGWAPLPPCRLNSIDFPSPPDSSNILYAKEDKVAKKLVYVCQKCQFSQPAENPVVYRHELIRNVT